MAKFDTSVEVAPYGVTREGIKLIGICELFEAMRPEFFTEPWANRPSYDEQTEAVKEWCEKHGASYYSACRENFFPTIYGVKIAQEEGNTLLVCEDLS